MRSKVAYISALLLLGLILLGRGTGIAGMNALGAAHRTVSPTKLIASDVDGKTFPISRVVDGDTVDISVGGADVRVRLIGLDTPETVDPRKIVQCFGHEASDKAKQILTGTSVSLELDPSQGMYDKYGRLLAYVYAPLDSSPDGLLFNEFMIAEGYGHEYTYDLPYKYQKDFKAAEKSAREQQKGLWSPSSCNGDTTKPAA